VSTYKIHPFVAENELERLARETPAHLAEILPGLPEVCQVFAAEALGREAPPDVSVPVLDERAWYGSPLVQEAALCGLAYAHRKSGSGLPAETRWGVESLSVDEGQSIGVRVAAWELAEAWDDGGTLYPIVPKPERPRKGLAS
jgi:hypothetical protein